MYWYNPTTQTSERVAAPSTDEEALDMLTGDPDSARFVKEYIKLRHSGIPIEPALVLVGHEFRLRESEYQLVGVPARATVDDPTSPHEEF
jgi:hypothetical protein